MKLLVFQFPSYNYFHKQKSLKPKFIGLRLFNILFTKIYLSEIITLPPALLPIIITLEF
jgi:hypothetical protein